MSYSCGNFGSKVLGCRELKDSVRRRAYNVKFVSRSIPNLIYTDAVIISKPIKEIIKISNNKCTTNKMKKTKRKTNQSKTNINIAWQNIIKLIYKL